ncbi:MAG: hypothetical protein PHH09_07640 [Methanoregulaceae archaeon]|nr:hypothetical protein [Methanoregulaceae archaeon]
METKAAGTILYFVVNTHKADGTPITWAGSPSVAVTKDGGTTTETDGVSLSVDAGTVVGRHIITIDTSQDATFFATGHKFSVIVTAGTVDSISTVGLIVAEFELGEVPANVAAWNGGALPVPAVAGDAMTLTEAYDAAKTAAQAGDIPDISALALEATVAALNDLSAAEVNAEVDTALADYDGPTKAEMDAAHALLATAAALATVDGIADSILEDTGTTIPALIGALHISQGSETCNYTVYDTDGVTPLSGVKVEVTTGEDGSGHVTTGWTNAFGIATFKLDSGIYYLWRSISGKSFENPDTEVVE